MWLNVCLLCFVLYCFLFWTSLENLRHVHCSKFLLASKARPLQQVLRPEKKKTKRRENVPVPRVILTPPHPPTPRSPLPRPQKKEEKKKEEEIVVDGAQHEKWKCFNWNQRNVISVTIGAGDKVEDTPFNENTTSAQHELRR